MVAAVCSVIFCSLETLWLRLLGRRRVQQQAIAELAGLPANHPYQKATLELVYNLQENLRVKQNINKDDRELLYAIRATLSA